MAPLPEPVVKSAFVLVMVPGALTVHPKVVLATSPVGLNEVVEPEHISSVRSETGLDMLGVG